MLNKLSRAAANYSHSRTLRPRAGRPGPYTEHSARYLHVGCCRAVMSGFRSLIEAERSPKSLPLKWAIAQRAVISRFRAFLPSRRGGAADTDSTAMRGRTLALLAAAADAAKWPLGQLGRRCRDAAYGFCARVRHIYRRRASRSLKHGPTADCSSVICRGAVGVPEVSPPPLLSLPTQLLLPLPAWFSSERPPPPAPAAARNARPAGLRAWQSWAARSRSARAQQRRRHTCESRRQRCAPLCRAKRGCAARRPASTGAGAAKGRCTWMQACGQCC